MSGERCDRTELLVDECACPSHRGGDAPGEDVGTVGQAFRARFPGTCARCGGSIAVDDGIARVADGEGYAHAPRCPR